jgi:hypothetical protein
MLVSARSACLQSSARRDRIVHRDEGVRDVVQADHATHKLPEIEVRQSDRAQHFGILTRAYPMMAIAAPVS